MLAIALAVVTWLLATPMLSGMWPEGDPPNATFRIQTDQAVWLAPDPELPQSFAGPVNPGRGFVLILFEECVATGTYVVRAREGGPVLHTRDLASDPLCPDDRWVWK